jgi:hypothetical protein
MSSEHYQRYNTPNLSEYNSQQFDQNNYNSVYSQQANQPWSLNYEKEIEYEKVDYYVTVSSQD